MCQYMDHAFPGELEGTGVTQRIIPPFKNYLCLYVGWVYVHMNISVRQRQKMVLNPLELELHLWP